jgi:phage-related baseplate assembly protein
MGINNLPDIEFCNADAETVENYVFSKYQEITGRSLTKGDPVRLFLLTISSVIIQLLNNINETGRQNLLRYARGDNLEHLGALVGVDRIPATAAVTTMQVTLSAALETAVIVPAGTRFTAGDNVFFALDSPMIILAGEQSAAGSATCLTVGIVGNGYLPGQIKTLVDPLPYVASVSNITASEGGAEKEDDDSYREAIHEAPEKFSCAGPDGAYEYFAKRASALITDVAVTSPEPGKVQIVPLLEGGEIPGEEILDAVLEVCNDRTVRPLTDQVMAVAPTEVEYDVTATYYISRADEARAAAIQQQVTEAVGAYVLWQKSKLGRDVNPSELVRRIMDAGAKRVAVTAPAFAIVSDTQVAVAKTVNVTLGGMEVE